MYTKHVEGLLIEENVFDHNGWAPDVEESACATMYNHNLYLTANDLVVRGNVIARAASIGIKMVSVPIGSVDRLRRTTGVIWISR